MISNLFIMQLFRMSRVNTFKFITGKPVTLHLKNIQKSDKYYNILNNPSSL